MRNIQVKVLTGGHQSPGGMMMFLARLTQRGHSIKDMSDLLRLYDKAINAQHREALLEEVVKLPHGTITRFSPITIAIVGASRRFLAQARTHQVGMTYVSASLQYSDYSNKAEFVIPYEMLSNKEAQTIYLENCAKNMDNYKYLIEKCGVSNDTAGYIAPQGLRNILIIQGNNESWAHFVRLRSCNRNTLETQYVALRIWEELLSTTDGKALFKHIGPDCNTGLCREGKFSCGKVMKGCPTKLIHELFPLIGG